MAAGFLLPHDPVTSVDDWTALGGGGGGGGGFPPGARWAGGAAGRGTHRYVVCNAAEGEPGTFKDRRLMRDNPYQLIEGLAIAAFAIGATEAFIGLKAGFTSEIDRLQQALTDMIGAGLA